MFICHQRRGISPMTKGKTLLLPGLQCFPFSDRDETWLIDMQREQEELKCFWKPSGSFAIVYLNSSCCVGLSAQLMMVTKAGGLRTKHGSLAVLHHHHYLRGKALKKNFSGGYDYKWFLQQCALRPLGCLSGKRSHSVTKGRVHSWVPWQKPV